VPDDAIFAVLDVETTGFSPLTGDRIIEIAVVRVSGDGSIADEYATLVNPQRPVGPSDLHGISQKDVEEAPTFEEIAGEVLERLEGLIVVGHNVRYDRDFLAAELTAGGVFLPSIPCLCTLKLAYRLHPEQVNHRMSTCCAALSLDHYPHDALEEARATVRLLSHCMEEAQGSGVTIGDVLHGEMRFPKPWPRIPSSGKVVARRRRDRTPAVVPLLARIAAGRSGVIADEDVIQYLDLLDRALEDRRITEAEAGALEQTAEAWGLSGKQVHEAHEAYLRGVMEVAVADGWITMKERHDLQAVVALLRLGPEALESMIAEVAEDAP
jgi:DNA polymerase-3 subunit epsilon